MLSLAAVVWICIMMSSETLNKKEELALEFFVNAKAEFLRERMQYMMDICSVISNRTVLREDFELYLIGKISQAEYELKFKTRLKDSLKLVPDVIGVARYTLGNEKAASEGEELAADILTNPFSKNAPRLIPITLSNGKETLAVISPIFKEDRTVIGNDAIIFSPSIISKNIFSTEDRLHNNSAVPFILLNANMSGKTFIFISEKLRRTSPDLCNFIISLAKSPDLEKRNQIKSFDDSDYLVTTRDIFSSGDVSYSAMAILKKKSLFSERKEEIAVFGLFIVLFTVIFHLILYGSLHPIIVKYGEYFRATEELNKRLKNEIAKHERYEALLKDSEMRFRSFMENIPGLVFVKDEEGRFAYINDYFKIRKYADTEKWLGKTETDVLPVCNISVREKTQEKILSGSAITSSIECLKLKDEYRYFAVYRFPIVSEKFQKSYGGVAFDVSDLLNLESELLKQKEQLSLTLHSISDGVVVTDKDGRITIANKVAAEILEYSVDELNGKKIFEILRIFSPADGKKYLADSAEKFLLSPHKKEKLTVETRSGAKKQLMCSYAPVVDQERVTIGYVMVFKDVTADEKLRDCLARSRKFESIGVLAGGIAHDFNNVLEAVIGNIGLAKMMCQDNPELAEVLQDAENAIDRAKDISNRLLLFSKGGVPTADECNTKKLLENLVPLAFTGSDAKVYIKISEDIWNVFVDESLASQAILNIITNARQAIPEQGGIFEVSASNIEFGENNGHPTLRPGKYVMISFKDNGPGIPPENLDKVFDPYYTTKTGAQGLGLTMSYSIVSKQNGTIEIENNKGEKGVTCRLYLPAKMSALSQKMAKTTVLPDFSKELPKQKILVMDDEESILKILKSGLERLGQEVSVVRNGEEAIAEYKKALSEQKPFNLVILDLTIVGGMGGRETIKELREIDPNVIAIVSSGYSPENIVHSYKEYGFKYSLPKPYTLGALKELLLLINHEQKIEKTTV